MIADQPSSKEWPDIMQGRELFHATPLHYLPSIFSCGALLAQSVLAASAIAPRATAFRRDRMLALQDYIHFSFEAATPLLADKLACGYPHAVLAFDAGALAALPEHALLPFNTKAWRTRSAYRLVVADHEKARLVLRREHFRELNSLEFLVKYAVGLQSLVGLIFVTAVERDAVTGLCRALGLRMGALDRLAPELAPVGYAPSTWPAIAAYFEACRVAGSVLAPPQSIPFDVRNRQRGDGESESQEPDA